MIESMKPQIDSSRPIPDISIFDLKTSFAGYRINKMANSLNTPENRDAFKADEEGYMTRFSLTEAEKVLIRQRDFSGLIDAGGNIYFLIKIAFCTGSGLYRMGAKMRGESYEEFLATRNDPRAI